jgi:hypothetical protein
VWKQERVAIHHEGLHRVLWAQRRRGNRVVVKVQALVDRYGVSYDLCNDAVLALVAEGRMRCTGYAPLPGGVKTYELVDPDQWRAGDPGTHATASRRPLWG